MLSLDCRNQKLVLREYCTYDKPDYNAICKLTELGIQHIDELKSYITLINFNYTRGNLSSHSNQTKRKEQLSFTYSNFNEFKKGFVKILKIIINNCEHVFIYLDYNAFGVYGSSELLTYIQLQKELT